MCICLRSARVATFYSLGGAGPYLSQTPSSQFTTNAITAKVQALHGGCPWFMDRGRTSTKLLSSKSSVTFASIVLGLG